MNDYSVYVGLDVHEDSIAVASAPAGRDQSRYWGEIANTPTAMKRLLHKRSPDGQVLGVCYEAGPFSRPCSVPRASGCKATQPRVAVVVRTA